MNKVKIGLRGLNAKSLVAKADDISNAKAWGVLFSKETKTLVELDSKRNDLESAIQMATYGDKRAIEIRRNCETKIKNAIRNLAAFVNHKSDGDIQIILDAGFEIKRTNNRPAAILTPVNTKIKRTDIEGQLIISWKPVQNSRNYIVQSNSKNPGNNKQWAIACFSTKSRCTLSDLTPGTTYWIRIRAIGSEGMGPPSEVVQIMAA